MQKKIKNDNINWRKVYLCLTIMVLSSISIVSSFFLKEHSMYVSISIVLFVVNGFTLCTPAISLRHKPNLPWYLVWILLYTISIIGLFISAAYNNAELGILFTITMALFGMIEALSYIEKPLINNDSKT